MSKILKDLIDLRKEIRATAEDIAREMELSGPYVRQIEAGGRSVPTGFLSRYMAAIESIHHHDREAIRAYMGVGEDEEAATSPAATTDAPDKAVPLQTDEAPHQVQ